MRRRQDTNSEAEASEAETAPGEKNANSKKNRSSANPRLQICGAILLLLISLLFVSIWYHDETSRRSDKGSDGEIPRSKQESDQEMMQQLRKDIDAFIESEGAAPPTYGITRGQYGSATPHGLRKLHKTCNFNPYNATEPPRALLKPGRLTDRDRLSDMSLCFLFYSQLLWTRATGGPKGYTLTRIGSLSNKEYLAEALEVYRQENECASSGAMGAPTTVLLKDASQCEAFFTDNRRWNADDDALWFVKDANGSLGRHISLLRQRDISDMSSARSFSCPMPGRLASLEVPSMWTPPLPPHNARHKFDHRYYVLIPSLSPLSILVRPGYLRFSAASYERQRQPGEAPEEDFKRHVTNLAVQLYADADAPAMDAAAAREVLRPVGFLSEVLAEELGSRAAGAAAAARLKANAHNAILQALFAMRPHLRTLGGREGWHVWGLLAVDVAYDEALNAFVLDVNTGPAPTGRAHPDWYLQDRSATIREAVDLLQNTVFRLLVQKRLAKSRQPDRAARLRHLWERVEADPAGGWEEVYHEATPERLPRHLLRPGQCYRSASS